MKSHTLSILAVLMLLGGGGIFYATRQSESASPLFENESMDVSSAIVSSVSQSGVDVAEAIAEPEPPPLGYIEYRNSRYGFSYWHSPEAKITEYDEGGGAMTVVQENAQKMRGLQIFIVPYAEDTISEERFRRDVPSGVRTNVEETSIGLRGVRAVTFHSYDPSLGETREVWFIHNGYLFEVTTFKGFGEWFSSILKTWRFL